ncbi:MAG: WG repeat-containing protein [Oscillospiraceae bacterium]|nr:WG repeat-containing protein [Oscillospiraceae bacterium]
MICQKCGEQNSDKAKYCFDCNTELKNLCDPPVAEITMTQDNRFEPEAKQSMEKEVIEVNPDDFLLYVNNRLKEETGFNSAQDYLNHKKPMKNIWRTLLIGSMTIGAVASVFLIIRAAINGGEPFSAFLFIIFIFFCLIGLVISYIVTYFFCGIINAKRNSEKHFLPQTADNKIDLKELAKFLHMNMHGLPFGEWSIVKLPLLEGVPMLGNIESNIEAIECVFKNRVIHRIVHVEGQSFYRIHTVNTKKNTAEKIFNVATKLLETTGNPSNASLYTLYKSSHLATPLLKAAVECYFASTDGIMKTVNAHRKPGAHQQAEYSSAETFANSRKKSRAPIIIVALTALIVTVGVGIFIFLSNRDKTENESFADNYVLNDKVVINIIEIVPPRYDWVGDFYDGLAVVGIGDLETGTKGGFVDMTGNEVIPLIYDSVWDFYEGLAAVGRGDRNNGYKLGFIDTTGIEIIPLIYDSFRSFHEGMAAVGIGDRDNGFKWGFINTTGNEIVPLIYDSVLDFYEGMAAVGIDDWETGIKWGFVDATGNEVVPLIYDVISLFNEGVAKVAIWDYGNKWGFVDATGNEIVPLIYDSVWDFYEGMAKVGIGNRDTGFKWGFIDATGNEVIPLIYDDSGYFSEGLTRVRLNEKWGFIDTQGNVVIPFVYDDVGSYYEGMAAVQFDEKWGFIDIQGNEVIPFIYDNVRHFYGDMIAVWLNGKCGFIDHTGREIVPITRTYDNIWSFFEDLAKVSFDGKYGFIDKIGNEIVPVIYDWAGGFNDGLALVGFGDWESGFKMILIDTTGNELVSLLYDEVWSFTDGLAWARLDEKWGLISIEQ